MNHNTPLTPTDRDWYNAGIMAQRILQNDEIEKLKEKLNEILKSHESLRHQLQEANIELDIKQSKIIALGDRIKIMQGNTCTCILNDSGLIISKCLNH